jgi:cholesterol transport system auxiliary component
MTARRRRFGLGLLACTLLEACALLSKSDPMVPRYFTPELDTPPPVAATTLSATHARLRLGTVEGGPQLRERMMFRNAHELGYYDDRRWTERPEAYLRRALAHALFEERGLFRVASGPAPTLAAELSAFEEILGPQPRVRVQVVITLDDDRVGGLQETIRVEEPVRAHTEDDAANAAVAAWASALQRCVAQISDRVVARLAQAPP